MTPKIVTLPLGDTRGTAHLYYGGDVRESLRNLPEASVHAVVTSPPYFGLRNYGIEPSVWGGVKSCEHEWVSDRYYTEKSASASSAANFTPAGEENAARVKEARWREDDTCSTCGAWRGQLGLEKSPSLFVGHLVEVFAEVARVLRPDGTCWLNLGDSYSGHPGNKQVPDEDAPSNKPGFVGNMRLTTVGMEGLKAKDLMLVPFRVALAMQEAGWYLRSWAPWVKRTCLPEAVTDRPSNALEVVYLFAHPKSRGRYFYDADAVRKPSSPSVTARPEASRRHVGTKATSGSQQGGVGSSGLGVNDPTAGRNRRNTDGFFESLNLIRDGEDVMLPDEAGSPLAHVVNPKPYAGAHFAVMPGALVEPMVKASTSEHGVCGACGSPWERLTEKSATGVSTQGPHGLGAIHRRESLGLKQVNREGFTRDVVYTTVGWSPTCECPDNVPVPATVLDPFSGSGTVGMVALREGRSYVGLDRNAEYLSLAEARITEAPPPQKTPDVSGGGEAASVLDMFGEESE